MRIPIYFFMLLYVALYSFSSVAAFDPGEFFAKKCMSCHTVGKGDDVGPDLKDVGKRRDQQWLVRFIQESQTMIEEGDPVANQLFQKYKQKKMPDTELTNEEVNQLLEYIATGKVKDTSAKIRSALDANAFDIKQGEALFVGKVKFAKGGPACFSCHKAGVAGVLGGGTLGPDLTTAYSNYSDKGLTKVIRGINFPTMVPLYDKKPLTDQEVYQLKSFLFTVDRKGPIDLGYQKKFFFLGVIGFLLLLGFFDLLWKGRVKKTRRPFQD